MNFDNLEIETALGKIDYQLERIADSLQPLGELMKATTAVAKAKISKDKVRKQWHKKRCS